MISKLFLKTNPVHLLLSRLLVSFFLLPLGAVAADHSITVETGAVWQHRNDVKIRPSDGTYFEFDELNQGPFLHHRIEGQFSTGKNRIRLLYAPFKQSISGVPGTDVTYKDTTFSGSSAIDVDYQFNSYRASYIWPLSKSFDLGVTLKVRDAEITLSQGASKESYSNVGVVPLIYIAYNAKFGSGWGLSTDMDFAGSPQGRAIDFSVKVRKEVSSDLEFGLGLRSLEGGADNDKVFTFSWFNYALIDLVLRL